MSTEGELILVVDDETTVREVVSEKLKSAGFTCTGVGNAAEALRELEAKAYSLALLDIRMPGISGMELLREIRIAYPDTAVIMVTAVAETKTAVEAMRLGASDYIVKPFNLDAVLLAVEKALEIRGIMRENREYRLHLEEKVREQTEKVRELFLNSLKPLAQALEDRDPYWRGDSERTMEVGAMVARELSLSPEAVEKIRLGMQLHNLGKVGVKEEILHKKGRLSREEYDHVMQHMAKGERLLTPVVGDREVMDIIKYHHERWDGKGARYGLKGPEIPLLARIAALANAFVAMTSPRPHRGALSPQEAREEILNGSGKEFDPHIVAAFLRLPVLGPTASGANSE